MSSGNQLFYLPQRIFVSETGSSLSNSLEVPLKTAFHLGSENLPSLLDLISGESSDTVVSPLYRRKFGMRFTEIVGSEHRSESQSAWTEELLQCDNVCCWIQTVLQELQFLAEGTHAVLI